MRIKKSAAMVSLGLLLTGPAWGSNPMKDVFSGMMDNSSRGGVYQTSKRMGVTGPSYSMRIPQATPRIVSFSPPKADVGCGGADFFLGGFSIINKDQMVQVARGIANGAAAYAFRIGMQAVCATCEETMTSLSDTLNKFNQNLHNSCEQTMNFLATQDAKGPELLRQATENSFIRPAAIKAAIFGDSGEAATAGPSVLPKVAAASPETVKAMEENVTWNIMKGMELGAWTVQGSGSYDWRVLLMSLLGTITLTHKNASDDGLTATPIPPTLSIKQLTEPSTSTVRFLKCNDTSTCLGVTQVDENAWVGLETSILEQLEVVHSAMLRKDEGTLRDNIGLLDLMGNDYVRILERMGTSEARGILHPLAKRLAYIQTAQVLQSIITKLNSWSRAASKDASAIWTEQLSDNAKQLLIQLRDMEGEGRQATADLAAQVSVAAGLTKLLGDRGA